LSVAAGHAHGAPGATRGLGRAALLVVPAVLAGNLVGYLFTVVVARQLGPAAYGALGGLLAIVIALAVPGMALQLVVARRAAVNRRRCSRATCTSARSAHRPGWRSTSPCCRRCSR